METDGGGWTLVMNINPVDGNIVGWGNDFWAGKDEYGTFEHRFARDYKSPAAHLLKGDELMIQSVHHHTSSAHPPRCLARSE